MSTDGGLRQLEIYHIKGAHFQPIETWSTGQGVPDVNVCIDGVESWIENKSTSANAIKFETMQIAWIERRLRNGGRVFIAVRRRTVAGPRKGAPVDELHVFRGSAVRALALHGLAGTVPSLRPSGNGPARWPWEAFRALLIT